MAISKELEAKILRYHFVEHWGPHTIATQLGIHHSAVDRVLSQAGMPKAERARRASIIDPYLPFIIETLAQYPKLTATRLYTMAQLRGYPGGPSHFRSHVAQLRPRKPSEAYLRLRTWPGEQSQVDWAHFDSIQIGRAKRPLMAFVMVLSWSRRLFLRFYLNQRLASFLHGHVAAFNGKRLGNCRIDASFLDRPFLNSAAAGRVAPAPILQPAVFQTGSSDRPKALDH